MLYQEISEQPTAIARLLDAHLPALDDLAAWLGAHDVTSVVIAARGTSDNAARYAQYLLGVANRLPVALATPSLVTVYGVAPRYDGALVIGVSQSGQSPDIVAVLDAARQQGRPTLAITNDPGSPLARVADRVLDLHAGPEQAVAATKTYTTSLAALALVSIALDAPERRAERSAELRSVPAHVAAVLDDVGGRLAAADRYCYLQRCAVLGRGLNYGTAFEVALKVKEMTGIVADAASPSDFLHGPIATVGHDHPVILVAPDEPSLESLREVAGPLHERGAELVVISADAGLLERATVALPLASQPPAWLTPLVAVLPGQHLAAHLAALRGVDLDQPAGLHKVTRTH